MFLADAVAAYVDNLTEREFDAPFIALLYQLGFTHVHLVHGQYEFGKDFIARRDEDGIEYQYCFQSKAGDLGVSAWRELQQQIHAMRTGNAVHPAFDPALPRRLVVVTTGRLKGGAGVEFQSDNDYRVQRGEVPAELWDVNFLLPWLEGILVEAPSAQRRARTLELLGRLGQGLGERCAVQEFARDWYRPGMSGKDRWGHVLTGALLAKEAADQGREDLACQIAFQLIRAAWETSADSQQAREAELDVARRLFSAHAQEFWDQVRNADPIELTTQFRSGLDLFVTHPVKAARLTECLSLLGIFRCLNGESAAAAKIGDYLTGFVKAAPGAGHPVSDEWSYSLLVTSLFLVMSGHQTAAARLLRDAAVWSLDRVEFGQGIAQVGEPADRVVEQLLGPPYQHVRLHRQASLYGFAVILDMAHVCGFPDLFSDLLSDLDAIDAMPTIVVQRTAEQAELIARVSYSADAMTPAAHHRLPMEIMTAAQNGQYFDCLASWATMRDRHLPSLLHHLTTIACSNANRA